MIGHLYYKRTLLGHVKFVVHRDHHVFSCQSYFQSFIPQSVLVHGVISSQAQDLAFLFAELHEIHVDIFLQLVKVPLNGNTTILHISLS